MNKKKKIIILLVSAVVILLIAFGAYYYFVIRANNLLAQQSRQQIEDAGFNNINGTVKSVEGDSLRVLAEVPESYSLLPAGEVKYIEKEFLLNISTTTEMYSNETTVEGNVLTKLDSISGVKPNAVFSAIVKENVLKNNELNVVELTIIK
jgi:hypothetical protein